MSQTVVIEQITDETRSVKSFILVPKQDDALASFAAGAHITIELDNGLSRPYSLTNGPNEKGAYHIAVLNDPNSTGGSSYIHRHWKEGDELVVGEPLNQFQLDKTAHRHILIAGGIGITPIWAMAKDLQKQQADFKVYYCSKSAEQTTFMSQIKNSELMDNIEFIHDQGNPAKGIDLPTLLAQQKIGDHVYICGPQGLIQTARDAAAHWANSSVHFELFSADDDFQLHQESDSTFSVQIASSGAEYEVLPDQTILHVLAQNGIAVDHLCQEGYCGSCLTEVIEGTPDHRDSVQTDEEKQANDFITVCCSRSKSKTLVLDL